MVALTPLSFEANGRDYEGEIEWELSTENKPMLPLLIHPPPPPQLPSSLQFTTTTTTYTTTTTATTTKTPNNTTTNPFSFLSNVFQLVINGHVSGLPEVVADGEAVEDENDSDPQRGK